MTNAGKRAVNISVVVVIDLVAVFVSMVLAMACSQSFELTPDVLFWYIANAATLVAMFFLFRVYSILYSTAGVLNVVQILISFVGISVETAVYTVSSEFLSISTGVIYVLTLFCYAFFSRYIVRIIDAFRTFGKNKAKAKRALVVGGGSAGAMIIRELLSSDKINYNPVCIVDDDPMKLGLDILGVPIVGKHTEIPRFARQYAVEEIIIAIPSRGKKEIAKVVEVCGQTQCSVKILPGMYQLVTGEAEVTDLRDVDITDLLGRDQVRVNLDEIMGYIKGKTVLVTGGGGSIGSELCRQIARHEPKKLIILDIYENNAHDIQQELRRKLPDLDLVTLIASVRDVRRMDGIFDRYRPDIVFNAAAHKHVPLMETSPNEAIKNNVFGTLNCARLANKYDVETFVQISTDKAVNPTNIMGASKRLCEMIIQTLGRYSENTNFVAVRFGNVLGSNGSVIPLFKKQIAAGGPVTVTHKDITRYFMTIPEAVSLVLQAGAYAKGGQIFVLDMGEPVRIYDLACNLIRLSGLEPEKDIEIKITGLRPGEKLYEERLMDEEGLQTTANGLISVARPIELDEDNLFFALDSLKRAAESESPEMKHIVAQLVPTYTVDERNEG